MPGTPRPSTTVGTALSRGYNGGAAGVTFLLIVGFYLWRPPVKRLRRKLSI